MAAVYTQHASGVICIAYVAGPIAGDGASAAVGAEAELRSARQRSPGARGSGAQ
ncbi:MAG: hypothetical protein ACYCU0_05035 [Solirubrobacteraceae bacterium]